ncbi:MAG TPA: nuclear transport factor 2 family protein [Longimicrobiales bacterium]
MNKRTLAAGLLLVLAACGAAGRQESAASHDDVAAEITAMLQASADAWNRGDLDGFLDDYLQNDSTTFTGASGTIHGTDEIRQRYIAGYWSTGRPAHRLSFEGIEVRPLGRDHALALGRYVLTEPDGTGVASTGYFTLVLSRTDHGWKIIHDHSSASE